GLKPSATLDSPRAATATSRSAASTAPESRSSPRSAQHQLAVARQLLLHLLVHLLILNAEPPHFVLALGQNLPHFFVEPVLNSELFHHALTDALRHHFVRLSFDVAAFHEAFYDFGGHVRHVVPLQQHPNCFP